MLTIYIFHVIISIHTYVGVTLSKIETLATITNGYLANEQLNANFTKITTALSNTLSRDGSTPNTVTADIDMNNNQLINLTTPTTNFQAATKKYVDDSTDSLTIAQAVTDCQTAQTAAELAETNAETAETNAETAETNAAASAVSAAASAVSAAASAALFLSVKDYGATGDNSTNDTAAIQAAEDAATALGVPVILTFPQGTYAISATINKKANVFWEGKGKLRRIDNAAPSGANFTLVVANGVDNWGIDSLLFENVDRTSELANSLTGSVGTVGASNACIDVNDCSNWYIKSCNLTKFARGIIFRDCHFFQIQFNQLDALTGKTVDEIIAGTYTPFAAFSGTGGIQCLYTGSAPSLPSTYYEISSNYITCTGLDVGIFALSQTYDKQPCIVTNNIIRGANSGIQVYRGSFTDAGSAPTYNAAVIIANNSIYATIEQGIYFRGSVGGQIVNNYIERAAQGGANGDTSAASICMRVNPFNSDDAAVFVSAAAGDVSDDHAIICQLNRIVSHGVEGAACDSAILCEINNAIVSNNSITRPAEEYSTARGNAILVGNGKLASRFILENNTIEGVWTVGISGSQGDVNASLEDLHLVKNNKLYGTYTTAGISLDMNGFNCHIEDNIVQVSASTPAGISVRQSVFNKINNNTITGSPIGVQIRGGTDLGACAHYLSGGVVSKNIRRGSSNIVKGNKVFGATTPFSRNETNGDDASFYGRCSEFADNYVDGVKYVEAFSGGTPASTFTARTHIKHDFIPNSSISETAIAGKYCLTSGQYGSTTTATGDTTNGSPIITNVSSLDGLGIGIFISLTGFSGTVQIISIDTDNDTATVNANAGSDNTGVTITAVTPTFVSPALSFLSASTSKNPTSLADGAGETLSFTVSGAALGDFVMVSAPYDAQDITITGYVQAADTVEVRLQNESGSTIDLGTGTWKVKVIK